MFTKKNSAKLFELDGTVLGGRKSTSGFTVKSRRTSKLKANRTSVRMVFKRVFDIVASLIGIIFLLPVLALVGVLIKLESSGPIFFRQERSGRDGSSFDILKFRTMRVSEQRYVIIQASAHDKRVTRVGAFLRRTSIDELPQLFNILMGHMSVVGPRPHAIYHDRMFENVVVDYWDRFQMRPGLTGLAQVRGYRGEIYSDRCIIDRLSADLEYIHNWSLLLDVYIFAKSIPLIFKDAKAY